MTPLKRYYLQHAESRALRLVNAPDFHSACHAVGWYPANTLLLGVYPTPDFRVEVAPALLSDCHAQTQPAPAAQRRDS